MMGRVAAFSVVLALQPELPQVPNRRGRLVVGLLIAGFFAAVVCAYGCSEYMLVRFEVRRRILNGEERALAVILAANLMSFAIVWLSSLVFVAASGAGLYLHATLLCACAQALWLGQHLWSYYRDHPRLRAASGE